MFLNLLQRYTHIRVRNKYFAQKILHQRCHMPIVSRLAFRYRLVYKLSGLSLEGRLSRYYLYQ